MELKQKIGELVLYVDILKEAAKQRSLPRPGSVRPRMRSVRQVSSEAASRRARACPP
jgi:hypothetical protein